MRSRELTRRSGTVNGRFCTEYEYDGAGYAVCDSAMNAMLLNDLFEDESLTEAEKEQLLPRMLFPDADAALEKAGAERFWHMVAEICWQAFGMDLDGTRGDLSEDPVFSWDEDAGRIRASLLQAYGIVWDESASSMSYAEFCDLVAGLMEAGETPLQQAIYYRTAKPPKETKHNREYVAAFKARKEHYRMKGAAGPVTGEQAAAAADAAMAAVFASEWGAAEGREVRHG